MKKNISRASLKNRVSPSPSLKSIKLTDRDLHETTDGQLMYEGDIRKLEKYFPPEGHYKVKQKIPKDQSDNDQLAMKYSKYQLPIVKQHILVKPTKVKLPKRNDRFGEDDFGDVNPLDEF